MAGPVMGVWVFEELGRQDLEMTGPLLASVRLGGQCGKSRAGERCSGDMRG